MSKRCPTCPNPVPDNYEDDRPCIQCVMFGDFHTRNHVERIDRPLKRKLERPKSEEE